MQFEGEVEICKDGFHTPAARLGPWLCFHCDQLFKDRVEAALHFGGTLQGDPICQLNAMEGGLVKLVRDQENELQVFRTEDTANNRVFYALGAAHATALRAEEERGYARGVRDIRALLEPVIAAKKRLSEVFDGIYMRMTDVEQAEITSAWMDVEAAFGAVEGGS